MRGWSIAVSLTLALGAVPARADRVWLESGRVLEGIVTEAGDKVVVALESGNITLPRSEVARVERSVAPLTEVETREAALAPNDRAGLMRLADYCRAHDLFAKERALLQRVIALEPNDVEARRRLGFVRTDSGWVERAVLADERAARDVARRRSELELQQKRAELQLAEARLAHEREKVRQVEPPREVVQTPTYYSYVPFVTVPAYPSPPVEPRPPLLPPVSPPPPNQPNYVINGVRDPASVIDDMQRRR